MAEDFFGELGKKISKATHSAVDKTSSLVESTKLSAQISGEQKEIDKLFQKIGEVVMRRAESDALSLGEEEAALAEEIRGHRERISGFRQSLASVKGLKICPGCQELIPLDVAFCPKCGAPTPVEEAEPSGEASEAAEVTVETAAFEEAASASEAAAEETAAAGEAAEAVVDAIFTPLDGPENEEK